VSTQRNALADFTNLGHTAPFLARDRGTAAAAPPPFRPGNPALCGSRPL